MTAIEKFLFEHDFDDEPAAVPSPGKEPPPPPDDSEPERPPEEPAPVASFTESDLDAARRDSHAEGYRQGLDEGIRRGRGEAEAAADAALTQALDKLAAGMNALLSERTEAEARRDREALQLAVTLVRKLFPALHRQHGLGEVEALIGETLARLRPQPQAVVRVSGELLEPLRARVDEIAARNGYDGKVMLVSDEALAPGDVQVEWSDGGSGHSTAAFWQSVDKALAEVLGDDALGDDEAARQDDPPATAKARSDPPARTDTGTDTDTDTDTGAPAHASANGHAEAEADAGAQTETRAKTAGAPARRTA